MGRLGHMRSLVSCLMIVMTMRLGHYFSFIYLSPFSFPIYCTMDTLPSLLIMPCGLCPSPLLSITHLTLTFTVSPTRASVPADVHLSCPSCYDFSPLRHTSTIFTIGPRPDPLSLSSHPSLRSWSFCHVTFPSTPTVCCLHLPTWLPHPYLRL